MWNVCRPAALKHLQRVHLAVREPLLHAHAAAFQSRSFADKPSLAGVDMAHVLTASRAELKKELGRPKISQVKRALSKQFTETMSKATITSEDLMELFLAADKVNLDTLLLSSFTQLKERFPEAIDFIVYGAVFRVLSFNHDGQQLWETYEFARTRYPANAIPELVYRFGVVGKVELGDMDGAQALLDEMEANGLEVSNEIYSRVISGYARANNIARVLDLHAKLDPSRGAWHESAIDRVILSLGVAGKPELAFQFYVNSNMKLNGSTLMTLLSVCRHNNCKQQAADILENRKRFPLQLNCRGYNRILETLEFLDQHDQIESVLEEMTNVGVAFDTRTKAIVARNQHVLKGTYFDLEQARQRVESTDITESSQQSQPHKKKTNPFGAMPRLKQLLEDEKIAEAVKFADEFVRPFTLEDLPESARDGVEIWSDALYVHPSIAKQCVSAYIKNGDDDKIAGLFKGFALTHSNVGYALQEIMVQYSNGLGDKRSTVTDAKTKIAYDAAKLLQSRNGFIHQAGRAFQLFFRFHDVDAVSALCDTLLDELSSVQHADSKARTTASRVSNSIGLVVRFFAESNNLAKAFALFDRASKTGVELQPFHYISLLAGMRTHSAHTTKTKGVVVLAENYREKPFYYVPDDFEKVLDSMAAHNVPVTLGVVGNVAAPLSRGDKRQRLRLIETYEAARAGEEDSYKLPPSVYSVLLQVSGNESTDVNEIKQIYADAVATLDTSKTERNSNRVRIPQDWEVVLISQLADKGHVDEAWAKLENLHVTTGAASYEATVKVLRAAITSQNHSVVRALFEFIEQRKFKPTLNDTYDLVHLAKEAALPSVVCDILDVYEEAHGRDSKDAVGHSKSHQSRRDKFAMRKIRSMYRVALKLCEETGDWKHALSFSTRVNELGLFENEESKSSDKASAGSVSTEPSKDA